MAALPTGGRRRAYPARREAPTNDVCRLCRARPYTSPMLDEPAVREGLAASVIAGEPPGQRSLYVLHGIYGRGRNWAALARHLCVRRADWQSILIDLRLHGQSPAFAPPHTVAACAEDVMRFEASAAREPRAVLGHSFGGKVALAFAARTDVRPLQVWIIDSTPEARPPKGRRGRCWTWSHRFPRGSGRGRRP